MARSFEPISLQSRSTEDAHEIRPIAKVKLADLLTDLTGDDGVDEYNRICTMMFGEDGRSV